MHSFHIKVHCYATNLRKNMDEHVIYITYTRVLYIHCPSNMEREFNPKQDPRLQGRAPGFRGEG